MSESLKEKIGIGNDMNAQAANLQSSQGALAVSAGNNVNLTAAQNTFDLGFGSQSSSSSWFNSSTTTRRESSSSSTAQGSSLGGNSVTIA